MTDCTNVQMLLLVFLTNEQLSFLTAEGAASPYFPDLSCVQMFVYTLQISNSKLVAELK